MLSTRIYRGLPPTGADAGIDFISYGGTAHVQRVEAWEMRSIWKTEGFLSELEAIAERPSSPTYADEFSHDVFAQPVNVAMPMGVPA